MEEEYFASLPTDKVGSALVEKTEGYYDYIEANGYIDLWRACHQMMYSGFYTGGRVLPAGRQGEKKQITVNHFCSLLQHIKVLTTDQRPVFEPKAVNTDYKSGQQVTLARSLLDYYMRQKNLEEVFDGCIDIALESGEGYIFQEWNPNSGKEVGAIVPEEPTEEAEDTELEDDVETDEDPISPEVKREGDIYSASFHPIDVVRDWFKNTSENNIWYIVRRRTNKYELAAKYPKFKEDIVNSEIESTNVTLRTLDNTDFRRFAESDQTYVFTFRHAKTSAIPNGRQVEFLANGTILFDGDLPYSELNIHCMMPSVRRGTNFGYTVSFDMLPIQQTIDMLDSTIVSNQNAFGVQNILTQKGSGLTCSDLTEGLNKLEYSGDPKAKPEPLKLLSTAPEIFNYKADLIQQMESISGVNSVSRGNPEPSLRSGASLALVQSMAIQFNSGLQHSYSRVLEKTGSGVISLLKDYAHSPRIALIAGISKRTTLKEFKGEDLDMIDRVIVDMGNPMSRTLAGRTQIADSLVEKGLVDNPEQYLMLLETGRLDPLTEGKTNAMFRIRSENEVLAQGGKVQAVYTDNHWLDIKEHATIISAPEVRQNEPDVVINTLAHIDEHIKLLRTTDPGILMILGQQPIPSPMNSPDDGATVPMPPPQQEEDTPAQGMAATPPPGGPEAEASGMGGNSVKGVELPQQPNNPLTGKKFDPNTGGM